MENINLIILYLDQSCMEDTELPAVVGIVEDGEGSAVKDEVLAAVYQPDQDTSVAVGWLVVPAQGEPDIVLLAGWESEGPVLPVEEQSGVQSDEEPGV